MSTEETKALMRHVSEEIWNKGNLDLIPEIISPDYVFHPLTGNEVKGIEGFKQMVTMFRTGAPDFHQTIDSQVVEGDMVAARITATGTFTGKSGDIEPTGKNFTLKSAVFNRMEGGKIVETWNYFDSLSMYQELGVAPPGG